MGMSSGSGDKKSVQSEINVTPLIDVLLVLLIIFLVVMPIMMKMETLEIPRKITENEEEHHNPIMLTDKQNDTGLILFNENHEDTLVAAAELPLLRLQTIEIPDVPPLVVKLKASGDLVFTDNDKDTSIVAADLARTLRPRLEAAAASGHDRVVFVDFDEVVPWANVVATMDSIRSLANDI